MIALLTVTVLITPACRDAPAGPRPHDDTQQSDQSVGQDTVRARLNAQVTGTRQSAIVDAAASASPSVVSVNVIRRERARRGSVLDSWFMPQEYERLVEGVGSGFILDGGIVITNQHVTDAAEQIIVTTNDGTDYEAQLLGEDPLTDIAVLKLETSELPSLAVGASTDLAIGEWVVAIGNPYSYLLGNTEPTITAGVVSAVGRNLLPSNNQPGIYVGMIQTDAAINPGNSGGPLVNVAGEVVGVNSSIFTRTSGSVGIGFAIPIERALRVAAELQRHGTVRRAWVGLAVTGSENLREWKQTGGIRVTGVAPGSPADEVGIKDGDVLASASGRRVRTFLDWEAVKLDVGPGDSLFVTTTRNGREQMAWLTVEPLPTQSAERVSVLDVEFITVTPQIRQERQLRSNAGAYVFSIADREARITGLRRGDVVLQINRQRITDVADVQDVFRRMAGGGVIRVYFERSGRVLQTDFSVT